MRTVVHKTIWENVSRHFKVFPIHQAFPWTFAKTPLETVPPFKNKRPHALSWKSRNPLGRQVK